MCSQHLQVPLPSMALDLLKLREERFDPGLEGAHEASAPRVAGGWLVLQRPTRWFRLIKIYGKNGGLSAKLPGMSGWNCVKACEDPSGFTVVLFFFLMDVLGFGVVFLYFTWFVCLVVSIAFCLAPRKAVVLTGNSSAPCSWVGA